ncbi:hypothetical protein [Methylobacterium currus]|uniref:hypothetical protein n=1 Tax=Methylobacterium currus TaxID=2051553 RepID=UPI0013DFD2AF|nr:hypothetical protein [Methylobacterium currus]
MAAGDSQGEITADGITVMRDAMDVEIAALRTVWWETWSFFQDLDRQPATDAPKEPPTSFLAILLHACRLRRIRRVMREFQTGVNAYEAAYGGRLSPRPIELDDRSVDYLRAVGAYPGRSARRGTSNSGLLSSLDGLLLSMSQPMLRARFTAVRIRERRPFAGLLGPMYLQPLPDEDGQHGGEGCESQPINQIAHNLSRFTLLHYGNEANFT